MNKKWYLFIMAGVLAAAIILPFAACGDDDDSRLGALSVQGAAQAANSPRREWIAWED